MVVGDRQCGHVGKLHSGAQRVDAMEHLCPSGSDCFTAAGGGSSQWDDRFAGNAELTIIESLSLSTPV
ncbi:hypothetical protein RRSWK_02761 [Rhodopirellula sp. SWK7]|nr:hypothetical protein RRSWK_02761 [Rhodopirellula sp. SWK7]